MGLGAVGRGWGAVSVWGGIGLGGVGWHRLGCDLFVCYFPVTTPQHVPLRRLPVKILSVGMDILMTDLKQGGGWLRVTVWESDWMATHPPYTYPPNMHLLNTHPTPPPALSVYHV